MRKVGPDGSIQRFSSWAFVTLKALTGWTSTYSLLGDRRHHIMSCSRNLDPDTCGVVFKRCTLILRETRSRRGLFPRVVFSATCISGNLKY